MRGRALGQKERALTPPRPHPDQGLERVLSPFPGLAQSKNQALMLSKGTVWKGHKHLSALKEEQAEQTLVGQKDTKYTSRGESSKAPWKEEETENSRTAALSQGPITSPALCSMRELRGSPTQGPLEKGAQRGPVVFFWGIRPSCNSALALQTPQDWFLLGQRAQL